MKIRTRYCVRLPGGLGNQLFSFFAANYIAFRTKAPVLLDFSSIDYSHHRNDKFDISFFGLDFSNPLHHSLHLQERGASWTYTLRLQIAKRNIVPAKFLGISSFPLNKDRLEDLDKFCDEILRSSPCIPISRIVEGYFGDFRMYDKYISENHFQLKLKNGSSTCHSLKLYMKNHSILGIHIRLGDFKSHPDSIGLLGDSYYSESIRHLLNQKDFSEIWVFSDSLSEVGQRVRKWQIPNGITVRFIDGLANPCEELWLLSHCNGIVTSNSTFSFWAAKFHSSNKDLDLVCIPSFFRKDNTTYISGIPSSWTAIHPAWIKT